MGNFYPTDFFLTDGLPDCAPGKCPRTAEISPIVCSSDLAMFFNNGYPTVITIMAANGKSIIMYFGRTVQKARNVMPRPQMLPKEIPAGDILNPHTVQFHNRNI